ncbi:MAG: BlaI/MecI/CopY family transcriptional regulator [Nocardioidaceae bacterium]
MPGRRTSAKHDRRERGALENEVLAALASADGALTPAEVLTQLSGELAYTTVMTTLARLHGKGVITRERCGRAYAYAIADGSTVAARRMRRLLDAGESREVVLARFLDELDPADVPVLQRLLGEASQL